MYSVPTTRPPGATAFGCTTADPLGSEITVKLPKVGVGGMGLGLGVGDGTGDGHGEGIGEGMGEGTADGEGFTDADGFSDGVGSGLGGRVGAAAIWAERATTPFAVDTELEIVLGKSSDLYSPIDL